jgi:hypothetical protein
MVAFLCLTRDRAATFGLLTLYKNSRPPVKVTAAAAAE